MNIGEINGVQVAVSPEAYAEVKKQKIIEENKILKEQQQELERYKNIIDELEKWIKEDKKYAMNNFECGRCFNMFDIINKLKELKGE